MADLKFTFTRAETNLLLEGLGKLSFGKVYRLVQKIQTQAQAQLQRSGDGEGEALKIPAEEVDDSES